MAACAVEVNPRGDFPAWLAARGMKPTFADAMQRELGISDYEELLACAEDAQVTAELLGTARDRLPFALYAVLRRLVLALAPTRRRGRRRRGTTPGAGGDSDDEGEERRGSVDEDDEEAGACGPRCEGALASRAVLGSLLDAIVATLSSLSRELLQSAQRFRCLEPALEPGYCGSIGVAGSNSPGEKLIDTDMVDDDNVESLADLQHDEIGMNGHAISSQKPCADRPQRAQCDLHTTSTETPFLSIKVEQEDETEGDTAAEAAGCRLHAGYSKPPAAEPQAADASSSQHSSSDSNFRVTLLPERDKSGSSPLDCDYDEDKEEEDDPCGRSASADEGPCRPEFLGYLDGTALALVDGGLEGPGLGALCRAGIGVARSGSTSGEKSRCCEQCGRYFSCRSKLLVHVRRHTGERPYRCSCCGKTFAQAWNLVRHRRIHAGQKPYECQNCGQAFIQQSELQKHKCQSPSPPPAAVKEEKGGGCAR
ncbi:uncharacterized protein LOC144947670 isoform X2 [Lampetra fluviatilis]